MISLPLAPAPFPAYYDHKNGCYLLDAEHGWTQFCKEDLKQHMRRAGWNDSAKGLTQLDYELMRIQIDNKVDYCGPIAGTRKGLTTMGGSRVLVTQSFTSIVPKKGEWPLLKGIIENLFDRIDPNQKPVFFSWCQIYLRALEANIFMPGQALVLAGPHECGKSFLQNRLTNLFGGRSANPWPYMSGETVFNSELFGSEHMQVEDPNVSKLNDRVNFAARIKQFTVNEIQPCHGKNQDIVTIKPCWRVTISINDEPYNLRAIPPIDDSTADKIIVFKCAPKSIPCESTKVEDREHFRLAVEAELPAFAWFLLNEWETPKELRSGRFGVTHFHHPEILKEINEQSPEFNTLITFDENNIFGSKGAWLGTIKQLTSKLLEYPGDPEAIKLARSERSLSLRMASLAKKYPARVQYKPTNSKRLWIIHKAEPSQG